MTLWHGRFENRPDSQMWDLNASISFDKRLALQDVRGSLAWATALAAAGILSGDEQTQICEGLQQIEAEFRSQSFNFLPEDEDIHTAVERRLGELIGALAGKLHTGRSRNDQVAVDFRLWLLDHLPELSTALTGLQTSLLARAETDLSPLPDSDGYILVPGYTHLQRAQPVLISHWWLSHFWPLQRDCQRLADLTPRLSTMPLGAGALAGTPFNIDRVTLTKSLGFAAATPNSMDAVSDRDFAAEFLFIATMIGIHLSKLAEQVIIFTSAEFGFFELSDAYSTGSSLMPQKKNPDPFELARGKSGTLLGKLSGLLTTLKGLPSTYDKDLQEDKVPVFEAYDLLMMMLPVMAGALDTLKVNPERMRAAIDPTMMATDLADYLVERSIPFREAHALTGQVVRLALDKEKSIEALTLAEYQSIHPIFEKDVYTVFDPQKCVARRKSLGGTAPEAVKAQLNQCRKLMEE